MSVQSDWQPASRKTPAEFDLDYVRIKVQSFKASDSNEIQVRIATTFDTDWMLREFEEWQCDSFAEPSEVEERCEDMYQYLKEYRDALAVLRVIPSMDPSERDKDELFKMNALINAMEQANSGLIRG